MAALPGNFNPETEEPRPDFDPIPPGEYSAVITESEEKPTSKGDGSYLQFTFEILDGEYKSRKLWSRLNLNNPNDQAVAIARAELAEICKAVGVMRPKDSVDLHNLPLRLKIGMEKRKDTGELQNRIKGYIAKEVKAPTAPTSTPPWKKK